MDSGAAASIPLEKGEGAGEIYFFQLLHLSHLSLSAFCGDSSVELVAVNPTGPIFLAAPALHLPSTPNPTPPGARHAGSASSSFLSRLSPVASRPCQGGSQQPLLHQGGRAAF